MARAASVAPGDGGPHDPGMDARVADLETDMKDGKTALSRMELAFVRMEVTLGSLATKADLAQTSERILALDGRIEALDTRIGAMDHRLGKVETVMDELIRSAIGKAIGPWQVPGILLACSAVVFALLGAQNWMAHQPWFVH